MLDSVFMSPLLLRLSDRNMPGGGCDVATREKTAVFLFADENYCLRYILILMHLSVAHKAIPSLLKLNTRWICWIAFLRWTFSYECILDSSPYMFNVMPT